MTSTLTTDTELGRTRHRLTIDDFHRMIEAGILTEHDRVELIDGELIDMVPMGGPHANCIVRLTHSLVRHVGDSFLVRVQLPLEVGEHSEMYPDLCLVRGDLPGLSQANPKASDAILVIEVADSTVRYDRHSKMPRYAAFGIPEAWLVDLPDETVTVYRDPTPNGYGIATVLRRGYTIESHALPDLRLTVDDVLGPAPS